MSKAEPKREDFEEDAPSPSKASKAVEVVKFEDPDVVTDNEMAKRYSSLSDFNVRYKSFFLEEKRPPKHTAPPSEDSGQPKKKKKKKKSTLDAAVTDD
jgi:hypothetical protein